jgi:hypothetical protein
MKTTLGVVKYDRGEVRYEKKEFKKESLEKWKHNMTILSITGDQVVSKIYQQDDLSIKKITEKENLIWSITQTESKELLISFLSKEYTVDFIESLAKNSIYVMETWVDRSDAFDKKQRITAFYETQMTLSAIRKSGKLNTLCNLLYHKLQLSVLLLLFFLLLGNYFMNADIRKEYETKQTELNIKQRNNKTKLENQQKLGRIAEEYNKIPDCSFALIADRIASYVPANVRLNLLSIFPVESGSSSMVRNKGLKIKAGMIVIRGDVDLPGSVTLFTQFLSADKLFSKVDIVTLSRKKDSSMFEFELHVTL